MQAQDGLDKSRIDFEDEPDDGFNAYIEIILKHRKMIKHIVGGAFVLSIIVCLAWPRMYEATARIIPPHEGVDGFAALFADNNDMFGNLVENLLTREVPASQYVGIMRSQTVVDALNRKFDLKKLYGLKYIEDVAKKLGRRSTIEISKSDKIIKVSVRDRDPSRAADLANAYVENLQRINRKLSSTTGRSKRQFLESRLKEVRNNLESAELNLKLFQEKHHLFAVEEQAKAVIESAAEIKSQIMLASTELEVFKQIGTEKQIEAFILKAKIDGLKNQLAKIEGDERQWGQSAGISDKSQTANYWVPLGQMPELSMRLMRLMREAKIQQKLFELLSAQYEMAQIEEAKDVETVQVLDKATPPEKKFSPKSGRIIISFLFVSILLSVFASFVIEYYRHTVSLKKTSGSSS